MCGVIPLRRKKKFVAICVELCGVLVHCRAKPRRRYILAALKRVREIEDEEYLNTWKKVLMKRLGVKR